jgi:restriction endonuclease S subunit
MLDKGLAKKSDQVLFIKVNNDGYDLGAQRREIDKNDLPLASEAFNVYKESISSGKVFDEEKYGSICTLVEKEKILANKDVVLNADRYVDSVVYDTVTFPIVKLEEVVEIFDNKRKPISKGNRKEGKYPYYGATGIVDYVDDFIFNERLVLVGEDGAKWGMGDKTAFIAEGKYWVNNHAHVLKPIQDKIIDTYLVEVFNYMDLNPFITGVTVPKLNQENLRSIEIPLPPLEIQEQIVKEIKGYQKIIDGAKMVVENYKPTISINPDWEMSSLDELCDFIDYRGKTPTKTESGIRLITAKNVRKGYINIEPQEFIGFDDYDGVMTRGIPLKGDVLFTTEAPLGNVALLDFEEKISLAQRIILLRPKNCNNLLSKFLVHILLDPLTQQRIESYATGSTVLGIKQSNLRELQVSLPSLKEQTQIVDRIEQEQELVNANKKLIAIFEQKIKDKINEVWGVKEV